MAGALNNDRWQAVVRLAHAAADLPQSGRRGFVQSHSDDPEIVRQALALADRIGDSSSEGGDRRGTRISRFIITDYLGRGGMGEVYAAHDSELERTVAIKLLNPISSALPQAEERFTREARIASALNHPNIVIIHEVVHTDTKVAIVMERVEGNSLREICGSAVPVARVVAIGAQVAAALAAAHGAGIVHRDVKPENIMVRPDGRVKVLDFGLARPAPGLEGDSHHSAQMAIPAGTWRYMSPEHYRHDQLTAKSDVFALGLVLYELSTGRHPFSFDSPLETLHAIAVDKPAAPSALNASIPPVLEAAILAALEKDSARRPTAAELETMLRQCEAAADGTESPSKKKRRWKLAVGAAAAIAVVAATSFVFRPSQKPALGYRAITSLLPENHVTAGAISPDGAQLAYANADGIFLRAIDSGETSLLGGPHDFSVDHLEWMPQSARIIASGFSEETNQPALWSISAAAGRVREIRTGARCGVPSPDGTRIAFLSADYSSIWTISAEGEDARQIVIAPKEDTFPLVTWAPGGQYLVFQRRHYSGNVASGFAMFDRYYDRSLEIADPQTGKISDRSPNVWALSAAAISDQRLLLLRPESVAGPGANQVREVRIDRKSGKFAGPVRDSAAPASDPRIRSVGLSATANGATVAVMRERGQAAVFVGEFEPTALRIVHAWRLTLDEQSNYPHAWTADSSSVIFESNRNGTWDIFRQRTDERVPDLVVGDPTRTEVLPQLSPDGKYVLYASTPVSGPRRPFVLMRVPVDGGPPEEVPTGGALDEFRCALRPNSRCVIRNTIGHEYFVYSELDPIKGIGKELARTAWRESLTGDWDVSPDGRFIALPNHDSRSASIKVIALEPGSAKPRDRDVTLEGLTNISGIDWTVKGDGWFVTIVTSVGKRVYHCDLEGRTHSLGDINGWVVPAPDGKQVAYQNVILDTNVWSFNSR